MESISWQNIVDTRRKLKSRPYSTALRLVSARRCVKRRKCRVQSERKRRNAEAHAFYIGRFDSIKRAVEYYGKPVKHGLHFDYERIVAMADVLPVKDGERWCVEVFVGGVVVFLCSPHYQMITPSLFFVFKNDKLLLFGMRFNAKLTHSKIRDEIWKRDR